jgi:protein-S-isoprenylcysteine O-methyltransferase Ste14
MRKILALTGSVIFLVIAPGFVAGLVPWWITHWRAGVPFFGLTPIRFAGGALSALGIMGLLECFARFALQGVGTPAPVFPTRHLVVAGLYRHVRNPMCVAVVSTILGQALMFASASLLEYGGLVWLLFHLFVLAYEEPILRASYGSQYQAFCAAVGPPVDPARAPAAARVGMPGKVRLMRWLQADSRPRESPSQGEAPTRVKCLNTSWYIHNGTACLTGSGSSLRCLHVRKVWA